MYGIFTYIWAIYGVNDGKYSVHGAYGIYIYTYNEGNPIIPSIKNGDLGDRLLNWVKWVYRIRNHPTIDIPVANHRNIISYPWERECIS
jgi:hypothetical protein